MSLGVCYYPEHWPEETWARDAARMKDLGLSWVRIGEFAWQQLEPAPGDLRFGWLDRAIDTLAKAGLKVVLGTPTATPPKWLVDRYDTIFQVGLDGYTRRFGSRRHYCFNSPAYLEETRRIVTLLAERYGKHEAVRAWQTDNEYGCHDTVRCICPDCEAAFRVWLRARYGTIEALNKAWWTDFWSMAYQNFEDVELPALSVTEANPSHRLDYYRFASDSVLRYNRLQCEILRRHSGAPVTHNAMLYFGHYDHFKLAQDLDIITWDNYPLGMLEQSPLDEALKTRFMRSGHPDLVSLMHDLYFGLKAKPFWVMEQQPGQVNWAPTNPLPAPGVVRLWSHQAFAHGADLVAYFRWRAARGAQELMHAGLNLHDGSPDQATTEVRQVVSELERTPLSEPEAKPVALLFDYENLWATDLQPHAAGWRYWALQLSWYSALRGMGIDITFAHPRQPLSGYRAVFAPALHLVDEALAEHLQAYVAQGGELIFGPRSGMKGLSNLAHAPAPGPLQALAGLRIDRVDALRPGVQAFLMFGGERYPYHTWADLLSPTTAEVLARYETTAYKGQAAMTQQQTGRGVCTCIGAWAASETLRVLFRGPLERAGCQLLDLPEGLRRQRRGQDSYIFNFNPEPVDVSVFGSPGTLEAFGLQRLREAPDL